MNVEIREYKNGKFKVWIDNKVLYYSKAMKALGHDPRLEGSHQEHNIDPYNTIKEARENALIYQEYHDGITVVKKHKL